MEYLAFMLAGVIISGAGRRIYMRYKQHKRRRIEQRRRLIRLRVSAARHTPVSVCNQYAAEVRKKKQNIICKGLYAEELADMLGGVAK